MKRIIKPVFAACILMATTAVAKENVYQKVPKPASGNKIMAGCQASTAMTDLDINNIRTLIFINSDMWWDLVGTATYEVPKNSGKTSLFAGAIWIGGLANSTTLKMAAQTYRQSGSDFWPGPVDKVNVDVSQDVCNAYDRHWKLTRDEVDEFVQYYASLQQGQAPDENLVPEAIRTWPGNGDPANNQDHFLAPFFENPNNVDGIYDWRDGDYPAYVLSGPPNCSDVLLGDQTLWWVFNDVGNVHDETGGIPIGLEVRAQAFAFATLDEINNMTFYKYQVINRSSFSMDQTYFGAFVDPDLGFFNDDYVGCDVTRGLGFCYNGDAIDEGIQGYGTNPPCVGVDFFEGPLADSADHVDNDRDSVIDEPGEKIIMSKFVYYNNDFTDFGNPVTAQHYYNYLKGIWKNGNKMTYGKDGHTNPVSDTCNFMFPGISDPYGWGTYGITKPNWDEYIAGNPPGDRRFIQSAGPFTLAAGAVNYITTGAVWARAASGGQLGSISLVKLADDKAQALFDNCFAIVNGPDAPDLSIREMDKEIIISLSNPSNSNNYKELYRERDPFIHHNDSDTAYVFEGYQVWQLKDESVSITDIHNNDKARLVIQCDINNGVGSIVNQYYNGDLAVFEPVQEVNGADKGLSHTFKITTDQFATGDNHLINHKTYYYTVLAYAYNGSESNFDPYAPVDGQNQPYKAGRRRIKTYTAIPHITSPEDGGTALNSLYGSGPEITRLEGTGNGFNYGSSRETIDLNQASVDDIIANYSMLHPTYLGGHGPVDIRIYDPVKVENGNFELWTTGVTDSDRWVLKNMDNGHIDSSDKTLEFPYDQLFPDYGMFISMNQVGNPATDKAVNNGYIEATIEYGDPSKRWLGGLPDIDLSPFNWILSGTNTTNADSKPFDITGADDQQVYEKLLGGTWAPYYLVAHPSNGGQTAEIAPGDDQSIASTLLTLGPLQKICSIDLVITSDKSKWSKCPVIEMSRVSSQAVNGARRATLRKSPSLDKDSNVIPGDTGMSYFPGYAINIETGERLNIAFGEDSRYPLQNGTDMIWNPTDTFVDYQSRVVVGGKHVVYVFGHYGNGVNDVPKYDEGAFLKSKLYNASNINLRNTWKDCMWTGYTMLEGGEKLLSTDLRIRLRVTKAYETYVTDPTPQHGYNPYYSFSLNNLKPTRQSNDVAKSALDLINVVPNPYYAYSSYEHNQLDNRVKIVNVPANSEITIYSVSGTVVRRLRSNSTANTSAGGVLPDPNLETAVDWDLKNSANVPIASGVYLIHVNVPGVGERTVKWFGVLRPIDLDTF